MVLTTENWIAIAGIIVAAVGVVITIVLVIIKNRPQKIIFEEIKTTSLMRVDDQVKDRLLIWFDETEVIDLSLVEVAIRNAGPKDLEDVKLYLSFSENTAVLNITILDRLIKFRKIKCEKVENTWADYELDIEFLNRSRRTKHKQDIGLVFTLDGDTAFKVKGGGKGWMLERRSVIFARRMFEDRMTVYVISFLVMLSFFPIVDFFTWDPPFMELIVKIAIAIILSVLSGVYLVSKEINRIFSK